MSLNNNEVGYIEDNTIKTCKKLVNRIDFIDFFSTQSSLARAFIT